MSLQPDYKKNWFKLLLGWGACFALRLIPFRAPNVEPIMATLMPFSKKFGMLGSFLFGFTSIYFYDVVTAGVGTWTWSVGITYGLVGVASALYFSNRQSSSWNYVKFAVVSTLAFDFITGIVIGPLTHHQNVMQAITGQIPFTMLHLLGNVLMAAVVSPLVYRWVMENKALEYTPVLQPSKAN